jgi:hypothetical protein
MKRFVYKSKAKSKRRLLLFAPLILALTLLLFRLGVDSLSDSTARRQKEILEKSLARSVSYCYAVEGAYPESLDYIRENYGLYYDESRFFVDYRVQGGNIRPEITVIELK